MNEQDLEKIGLNKNEAIVYSALIQLGKATAGEIIKKTEFHRNIVYDNLEKLADKGLISFISEGKIRIFQLNPPEFISDFLEKEQSQLDERKKVAENLKKDIQKNYSEIRQKQESAIYRGTKGVRLIMHDILETKADYVSFGAPKESTEIMGEHFWKNYVLKQKERKIFAKLLFNSSMRPWSKEVKHSLNEIRFLDNATEPITQTIVYKDKTAIIVWTEKPIITLITNKNVAHSYQKFFGIIWKTAKK